MDCVVRTCKEHEKREKEKERWKGKGDMGGYKGFGKFGGLMEGTNYLT